MTHGPRLNLPTIGALDGLVTGKAEIDGPMERFARAIATWGRTANAFLAGPDIQVFEVVGGLTTSHTWVKPANASLVQVICIAGGGGGGTGRSDINGTIRPGGGGGGGGGYGELMLPADFFKAREAVSVGVGGAGGINPGAVVANGTTGTAGATSAMDITAKNPLFQVVAGGGAGGIGAPVTGALAAAGGRATVIGGIGSPSRNDGGIGQSSASIPLLATVFPAQNLSYVQFNRLVPGGGSGGGISAANVISDGGDGSVSGSMGGYATPIGGAAAVMSGLGESGATPLPGWPFAGSSGAGGSAFGGGSGGTGGNAGNYGCGGGGASGKSSGSVVGDGGRGGDGIVAVITYF